METNMTARISELIGNALTGPDGKLGKIEDFYFDDEAWAIRYVVADTGPWLTGRTILFSPQVFRTPEEGKWGLEINLSKKQIDESPSVGAHKPISRQYEEEYYRYYGWPNYWQGSSIGGLESNPLFNQTPNIRNPHESSVTPGFRQENSKDSHLRSFLEVSQYEVEATDGNIGGVGDFLVDSKSWKILKLIIKTGNWFTSGELIISQADIKGISYKESKVWIKQSKLELEPGSEQIANL